MAIRGIGSQQFQTNPQIQRFLLPNVRATGWQLGVGSYGSVEEVEINGLVCAGKKLHEILIQAGNVGADTIVNRYGDECQLMSDLRHPNIVQFLGLCFLPASPFPLLVMEKLKTSLNDLLESSPNIPLTMKRSILADVSHGLVYLHTRDPPVIHRDLTARNVLLNSAMVAKISDLGNARIISLRTGQLTRTLSRLPGTMAYMAPEVFQETSRYGAKLDMFSFGHLGLFTVIQVFPDELLPSTYPDPNDPDKTLARSEVERRGAYFEQLQGQLGVGHPLEQLIRRCLHNAPSRRPSAEEALHQLEDMRALLQDPYDSMDKLEMVKTLQEKDREIQQLQAQRPATVVQMPPVDDQSRQQIENLQQQMQRLQLDHHAGLQIKEAELQQKNAIIRTITTELRTAQTGLRTQTAELRQKNAEISRLTSNLQTTQEDAHQKDQRLRQREVKIVSLERQLQSSKPKVQPLRQKQCKHVPFGAMVRGSDQSICSSLWGGVRHVQQGGGEQEWFSLTRQVPQVSGSRERWGVHQGELRKGKVSLCSTNRCDHPRAYTWVQCDSCKQWWHIICSGVSRKQAYSSSEYFCLGCR